MDTILIIEDDPTIQFLFAHFLTLSGYSVRAASNGEEGLRLLSPKIVAVICDINTPKMDGIKFLEQFQKSPLWGKIPFIFISGFIQESRIKAIQESGADCFLKKPIDGDVLRIVLLALLKKYSRINQEVLQKI